MSPYADDQRRRNYHTAYWHKNKKHLVEYRKKWSDARIERVREASKRTYRKNLEANRAKRRANARRVRDQILNILGGKCSHCGFSDSRALQVDHVRGQGIKDRRGLGHTPHSLLKDILKSVHASSQKYQLLCANCNWIKRHEKRELYITKIPGYITDSEAHGAC